MADICPFDPREWLPPELAAPHAYLHLSDRFDVYCVLDHEDYEWARQWKWCHTYGSGSFDENGVIARPDGIYARRCVGAKTLWLHREILVRAVGECPPHCNIGDHLNGDRLDNRRCNLEWATRPMNAKNLGGAAWKLREKGLTHRI
jgi:hypothetical protein